MKVVNESEVLMDYGCECLLSLGTDDAGGTYLLMAIAKDDTSDPFLGTKINDEVARRVKMGILDVLSALLTSESGEWHVYARDGIDLTYTPQKTFTTADSIPKEFLPGSEFYI